MAPTPAESRASWTNYPSLLGSLTKDKHRHALEGAALAQQCGRYDDANAIFHDQLPEASTIPILTLQRADGLTMQGCCHERIFLLEAALETVSPKDAASASIRMLMALMLADAQYWALGEMDPALSILPRVRSQLRKTGVDNLSDIELRCVEIYHKIVDAFDECCNFVPTSAETIFAADKPAEFKRLREVLQAQENWRFAPVFMQHELAHTDPGPGLKQAVMEAMRLCDAIDKSSDPPLRYRSAMLKKQLTSIMLEIKSPMAEKLEQQYISTIEKIKTASYDRWEDYWPAIDFDNTKTRIVRSSDSYANKLDQLMALIQQAEHHHDFTKANEEYISSRDVAREWFQKAKGTSSASDAWERLRTTQDSYVHFHQDKTGLAYFEADACADYQKILLVKDREYLAVLHHVEDFEARHPDFAVPGSLERLYEHAVTAARHLDMPDKVKAFTEKHRHWAERCKDEDEDEDEDEDSDDDE